MPIANLSDPLNVPFNEYRILVLGKRLKLLRKNRDRLAREIAATEHELSERTLARKENKHDAG